jgi:hypothetical protein
MLDTAAQDIIYIFQIRRRGIYAREALFIKQMKRFAVIGEFAVERKYVFIFFHQIIKTNLMFRERIGYPFLNKDKPVNFKIESGFLFCFADNRLFGAFADMNPAADGVILRSVRIGNHKNFIFHDNDSRRTTGKPPVAYVYRNILIHFHYSAT